jgi:hypothetical protein
MCCCLQQLDFTQNTTTLKIIQRLVFQLIFVGSISE